MSHRITFHAMRRAAGHRLVASAEGHLGYGGQNLANKPIVERLHNRETDAPPNGAARHARDFMERIRKNKTVFPKNPWVPCRMERRTPSRMEPDATGIRARS
ncbi:hypothetical protein ACLUWO_08355 [Pseudoscardovia radai]|uniref:hypothetical protein n=1 Tax=Pseudoscardovia radai TaxID=987066 RepID=UPI0039928187